MYSFNRSEAGIFVEIYLPKKSYFQGVLYECLISGFDLKHVKEFLQEKSERVRGLLKESYTERYEERVANMRGVFSGYSLYEVDGVFKGTSSAHPIEERTQVIRILFLPVNVGQDLDITSAIRETTIRDYLRQTGERKTFIEIYSAASEQPENVQRLLLDLIEWEAEVALFLFGFTLLKITLEIEKLGESNEEQEIWVTSFWNLRVNKITRDHNL